jgi:hypothetical protein
VLTVKGNQRTLHDGLRHAVAQAHATAITADIYAHVYHENKQAAVDMWDKLTG